jgi:hypothetical protein
MDWCELTEEEKKALKNKEDLPIIGVIKGLNSEDLQSIYESLAVKEEYREDFMKTQITWISDFKGYWGVNHNRDPDTSPEFGIDFLNSHEPQRFRLYYAAKYPERVEIRKIRRKTLDFLTETEDAIKVVKAYNSLIKK